MTDSVSRHVLLEPTACAICGTLGNADQIYSATFENADFNEHVFSARRLPDRVHYRMVRCRECGLVRSDPAADQASLSELYGRSTFDYAAEVPNLRKTYGRYLSKAKGYSRGQTFLEVGCGNGFMLEEAVAQGYQHVRGVEPSRKSIAAAAPAVREWIVADIMRPGMFEPGEFDTGCLFQVFDHVPDPGALLDQVRSVLIPGGVLLCFHHNVRSVSARMLGENSPIVDVEHCYLYSPSTMRLLLKRHGFDVLESAAASNTLSFRHLVHLFPASAILKRGLMRAVDGTGIGRISLRLRLGNLYVIARKT